MNIEWKPTEQTHEIGEVTFSIAPVSAAREVMTEGDEIEVDGGDGNIYVMKPRNVKWIELFRFGVKGIEGLSLNDVEIKTAFDFIKAMQEGPSELFDLMMIVARRVRAISRLPEDVRKNLLSSRG